jgi:hypothetical protein
MRILLLGLDSNKAQFLLNNIDCHPHKVVVGGMSMGDKQISNMIRRSDFVLASRYITHKYQHTARSYRIAFHTCLGGISEIRQKLNELLSVPEDNQRTCG